MNERLLQQAVDNPPPGLSRLQLRQRDKAVALLREESLMQAAFNYKLVPVDAVEGEMIRLGGHGLRAPMLIPDADAADDAELTHVVCAACTLGGALERRITSLFAEKRASLALALDGLGNELLFALGRRMQDRLLGLCRRQGIELGLELSAGDPGLELDAQNSILQLAGADEIGVAFHRSRLLQPLKSSTVVFAAGHNLPKTTWSRCERCPSRKRCTLASRDLDAA